MNPYEIIDKYYPENTEQRQILVIHSLSVAGKAMKILDAHPELRLNRSFVKEAALLHDIGIFQTNAPTIQCFGSHPYIAHGIWELKSCVKKVSRSMHWFANAIQGPDYPCRTLSTNSFLYPIARCCP